MNFLFFLVQIRETNGKTDRTCSPADPVIQERRLVRPALQGRSLHRCRKESTPGGGDPIKGMIPGGDGRQSNGFPQESVPDLSSHVFVRSWFSGYTRGVYAGILYRPVKSMLAA